MREAGFRSLNPNYRYILYRDKCEILDNQQGKCVHCGYSFHYTRRRTVIIGTGEIIEYKKYDLLDVIFHHVKPLVLRKGTFGSSLHTPENIWAICHKCHKAVHRKGKGITVGEGVVTKNIKGELKRGKSTSM